MANALFSKDGRKKESLHGRMPTKQSINLAKVDEKKSSIGIAIPAIILIVILAAVFSKFFVYDRLAEMDAARAEVMRLRSQVDMYNDALKEYSDVEETYAHYTMDNMTPDELALVDREMVLDLVRGVLPVRSGAKTWNVAGNILTIEVAESTLAEQNALAKKIEESPIVDSCTIVRANKDQEKDKDVKVRAIFTVYLRQPPEEEDE